MLIHPRRNFILASVVLLSACGTSDAVVDEGNRRPNILILMAEDLSPRIGAFGDSVAVTPNLDELAQAGVRYPNVFTTSGVCSPSRAAHITGMHQISIGGQHMRASSFAKFPYSAVPPPDIKAYPELLRLGGYYTFTNHKLDYQFSGFGAGSGPFTIWDYEGPEPDWGLRADGQPFFGLINLPQTHESQLFDKNVAANRANGQRRVVHPADVVVPPYYPDTVVVREYLARQYDNIFSMDAFVGDLLKKLIADGLADNTVIIWTTDHGDGLPRAKREIYDSGIKVPMIIFWPDGVGPERVVSGGVDERLISFVDFGPTVLSLAGLSIPKYMHGQSMISDDTSERRYIFASKDRLDEHPFRERAVRDNRYKYIRNYQSGEPGAKHIAYRDQLEIMVELWRGFANGALNGDQESWFKPRPAEELYDILKDPDEVRNLISDAAHQETLQRMRGAMDEWLKNVVDLSDQTEQEMAEGFWPGGLQPVTPPPMLKVIDANTIVIDSSAGASLGYKIDNGNWHVVATGDRIVVPEHASLSAKAVRYGWQESSVVRIDLE